MSRRKPHNHLAGYVCERKAKRGGHIVVWDAPKAGFCPEYGRWVVTWEREAPHESLIGPSFTSQRAARAFMKDDIEGFSAYAWIDEEALDALD